MTSNFLIDNLLSSNPNTSTFGLNLTAAWPLPDSVRRAYEELANELRLLDEALYVYPYEETHITVMTLIDFKKHIQPDESYINTVKHIIGEILPHFNKTFKTAEYLSPVKLKLDEFVLSDRAAYLTFLEQDSVIGRLRNSLAAPLRDMELDIHYPPFIHSTIVRFINKPVSTQTLIDRLVEISARVHLPIFEVDEILLTTELAPYMRKGEILEQFSLNNKSKE